MLDGRSNHRKSMPLTSLKSMEVSSIDGMRVVAPMVGGGQAFSGESPLRCKRVILGVM